MPSLPILLFRVFALAEGASWLGLLAGMYVKYVPGTTDLGVKVFGPIHGGLFVAYGIAVLLTAVGQRWSVRLTTVALLSAIPPLATVLFERWANSRGHLRAAPSRQGA